MASNKYLDFTGLSHFLDKIKSIFAPKKQGVEYINGTQTAATGNWTGETADNELYEGKMIAYRLPFAGSGNATLNLTFANGTTSGAKNVYLSTSTRMTTHVGAGNTIILVYHEANVIGSTTYQGWWMDAYYNTNDSAYYMYVAGSRGGHTVTNCPPNCLFLTQAENRLLPTWAGAANSTAATHVMTTEEFDPFGHIYYKSSNMYNAGALIGQALYYQQNVDLRYAFNTNGFDLLDNGVGTTVYMVCEPTTNGKAVLHDPAITKTLPIEDDGLLYVYLGRSYSSTAICLMLDHPVYMFDAEAGEAIAIDRSYLLAYRLHDETQNQIAGLANAISSTNANLAQEVEDREAEIDRVEALISDGDQALSTAINRAVQKAGDTMTGALVAPMIRIANTYYGVAFGRTTQTPKETIVYTGIKWRSSTHMPVVHLTGYAYGLASPVELKIGFYIYGDKVGWCGVVNMGSWAPSVYLFKYTSNSIDYVAIGLAGQCYFLQLCADVQDEMGTFTGINASSGWSFLFSTNTGVIPEVDGGTTCASVPYKADILNAKKVNGHTVLSDVPANAVFTDTTYSNATTSTSGLMSSSDKTKLNGIADNAQVNVIESVKVNGAALSIANKAVDVTVPTAVSDLANDSGFVSTTEEQTFTPTQQLQARENIGATGIEWIQSTQTAATGNWTGVSGDTTLYDGKIICYRLLYTGSGNASLNLTLANGDETGPIPVYWYSNARQTTHQAAGSEWLYIYHENYGSVGAGWWSLNRAYYTDNYPSYACREYTPPRTKTYLYCYMLCFSDVDKKLVPANNVSNSTATTKTLTTESFDPFGAIYYYGSTTAVADNGAPSENTLYYTRDSFDLRYSFNTGSTLTSRQPVYVVCEPQDDGRVKLAENPIVQTIPLEDNGLIYIYLGEARSTTAICLSAYHDIYKVYNGAIYNIKALML